MTRVVSKNRPHYASVVTPRAEVTEQLMAAYDSGERIMVDVRVVFAPPEGPWRGFFWIEDGPPVSKKFALLVEGIVVENK